VSPPGAPAPYGQQVPPLGQQKVLTSEAQSAVQPIVGSQQVGSWAQTAATKVTPGIPLEPAPCAAVQLAHSAGPAVQTSWHWQVARIVVVVVDVVVVVVVGGLVVVVVVEVVVVVVGA